MQFYSKFFEELSTRQLYEILRARESVFLLEQRIVCQDLDRADYEALQCFLEENGALLAYLRAYRTEEGEIKIGRVLSLTHGIGHGSLLMKQAIPAIGAAFGCREIVVHAQKHAQGFYESFGFRVTSPDFMVEGVLHVGMALTLEEKKKERNPLRVPFFFRIFV